MTRKRWSRISALAALCFLSLFALIHLMPDAVALVDAWASLLIAPLQHLGAIEFFLIITVLGGGVGVISMALAFSYLERLSIEQCVRLAFALSLAAFLTKMVKEFIERARPEALEWFDALPSFSFPSAHAMAAMVLYGFIAITVYQRSRSLGAVLGAAAIIILVGMSRVVLAAHYFSDVIGGYLLGLAVLALVFALPFDKLFSRYGRK